MKFEVGKLYRNRFNFKIRIYATDGGGDYPIHGAFRFCDKWFSSGWSADGRCSRDRIAFRDSDGQRCVGTTTFMDIVGEWVEEEKLK